MRNQGYCYSERLPRSADGRNVVSYLSERYRHSSPEAWRVRIEAGRVFVDGAAVGPDHRLRPGGRLEWRRPPWSEPEAPTSFAILYRDADLVAVAKPRGLATMPGGGFLERTLLARVRSVFPEGAPLHRLGRGTSGLVLFTRNKAARRRLGEDWRRGRVERRYRALVEGSVGGVMSLRFPIGSVPHPRLGSVAGVDRNGKPARTDVRLLERREQTSLVEVNIETGRTHQIRIHLKAAGHPLAGDPLYGSRASESALPGELGYWLHAFELRFRHPRTGRSLRLFSMPPPVLRRSAE